MIRILSLDWDYFIDADAETRLTKFPEGCACERPIELRNFIWSRYYNKINNFTYDVSGVKIKDAEFRKAMAFLAINNFEYSGAICESHKYLYDYVTTILHMLKNNGRNDRIELVNVDYHHDRWRIRDNDIVDCGNWAQMLKKQLKDRFIYKWYGQEDSVCDVYKNYNGLFDPFNQRYDIVFLCRSDMWSPPHLDSYFLSMAELILKNNINVVVEKDILKPRILV